MNEEQQPVAATAMPTCYRHPDRQTRLSCGRCGKPLCADCMHHGPVGIRCAECLRTPKVEMALVVPERVNVALGVGIAEAVVWIAIIAALGWKLHFFPPNLLVSGIAGGMVGWTIWRICGCSFNRKTILWSVVLGAVIPLLAEIVMILLLPKHELGVPFSFWLEIVRTLGPRVLAAMIIGAFFAWLLSSQRHWEQNLFDK